MKFLTPSIQSGCLFLAMIVYGCLSSPTPDHIGFVEILVGVLLCLSFRVAGGRSGDGNPKFSWVILCYGLSIPTFLALINGHSLNDIMRDIIPFFYLMLPVFLGWVGISYPERFLATLAGIGILFSIRTAFAYQPVLLTPALWGQGPPADLLYLANSPEVLFSALYCLGQGGSHFMTCGQRIKGAVIGLLALIPMVAMALMMQRAGIGAVFLYVFASLCLVTYHRPKWGGIFALLILAGGAVAWPVFEPVLFFLWQKTEIVGLNARAQEWAAVISVLSDSWVNMFFGEGWGGRIENPAVGGLDVNYTHSLLSSLLLKTGVIGTIFIFCACLVPVLRSFRELFSVQNKQDFMTGLMMMGAVIFPLLISVFLYASYKSLGFGLILLVFFIFPIRKLEKIQ